MAYHESVQLGHELSKRISEDPSSARRKGQEEEDDSSGDEGFLTETGEKQKASDRAAKEMLSVLEGAEDEPEAQGKYKKLFEMDFMKRASDQKKEKSREEAQNILREIQDMERDDESDDDDIAPNTVKAVKDVKEKDSSALIAARAEMKRQFDQSGGMSMALKAGSKRVTVSGPISVKGSSAAGKKGAEGSPRWVSEPEDTVPETEITVADEQNPWLAAPSSGKKRDSSGQQVTHAKSGQKGSDKLYVTVADLAVTPVSSIVGMSDKKGNAKGKINKQSNAAVAVGQKRPLAAGAADGNQKKNKTSAVTAATTGASQSNPSSSAPTAVTPAVKGVPTKERKPLLMQKSQVRAPHLACHFTTLPSLFVRTAFSLFT
jgi:Utp14 protein